MKTRSVKKFSLILLCVLLMSQLFTLVGSAENDATVDWDINENETELYSGEKVYKRCDLYNLSIEPVSSVYVYSDMIEIDDLKGTVCAPSANSEFVWVHGYIYATAKGFEYLEDFVEERNAIYGLFNDDWEFASFSKDTVTALDSLDSNESKTVSVTELANRTCYNVVVYDSTQSLYFIRGAIYEFDKDKYYYLNYSTLGNEYFDAYGDFSYRKGTVKLLALDDNLTQIIASTAKDAEYIFPDYTWEDDTEFSGMGTNSSNVGFWISLTFFGILLPIPLLVLGLLLPMSKKLGRPKHWYVLAVLAGLWLLLGAMLMLVLIII